MSNLGEYTLYDYAMLCLPMMTFTRINSMMTSRSTYGSLGHAIDKYWKCSFATDSLSGLQIVKGNPHSRKMLSPTSFVMSHKESTLMQVHQSRLPRHDRGHDSVVSSALASTTSDGS